MFVVLTKKGRSPLYLDTGRRWGDIAKAISEVSQSADWIQDELLWTNQENDGQDSEGSDVA